MPCRHWVVPAVVLALSLAGGGEALAAQPTINGKLAYAEETQDAPVTPRVMTVDPFGASQPSVLAADTWADPAPSWSPDGGHIAFARAIYGFAPDIWTVDSDLANLTQLTVTAEIGEQEPSWSPDGRKLAYAADGAIWVLDLGSGSSVRLSPPGVVDNEPSWSPVGNRIAFSRGEYGSSAIYAMDAVPGAVATRLTATTGENRSPSWSPDGREVAWARGFRSPQRGIWVMRSSGRGVRRLTTPTDADNHPTWSPDGRFIAFARTVCDEPLCPDYLWTMDADGGRERRVVIDQRPVLGLAPDWGRKVAAR